MKTEAAYLLAIEQTYVPDFADAGQIVNVGVYIRNIDSLVHYGGIECKINGLALPMSPEAFWLEPGKASYCGGNFVMPASNVTLIFTALVEYNYQWILADQTGWVIQLKGGGGGEPFRNLVGTYAPV